MIELNKHHIKYNLIFTGQHKETILNILDDFRLNKPDIVLYEGVEVTSVWGSIIWLFKLLLSICKNNKKLWKGDHKGIVLNHGDTLTTLIGCLIARIFGHTSAHIEAALRSYNLKHPFPEDIIRKEIGMAECRGLLECKISAIGEYVIDKYRGFGRGQGDYLYAFSLPE